MLLSAASERSVIATSKSANATLAPAMIAFGINFCSDERPQWGRVRNVWFWAQNKQSRHWAVRNRRGRLEIHSNHFGMIVMPPKPMRPANANWRSRRRPGRSLPACWPVSQSQSCRCERSELSPSRLGGLRTRSPRSSREAHRPALARLVSAWVPLVLAEVLVQGQVWAPVPGRRRHNLAY